MKLNCEVIVAQLLKTIVFDTEFVHPVVVSVTVTVKVVVLVKRYSTLLWLRVI